MVVGTAVIQLGIADGCSLKDKRRVIKSIISRLRHKFNVAIAEVDHHDLWQTATLGIVCVSNDSAYAHGLLTKAITWIETQRLDAEVEGYQIELF